LRGRIARMAIAGALGVATAFAGTPAHADTAGVQTGALVATGTWGTSSPGTSGLAVHTVTGTMNAYAVPIGLGITAVAFVCTAAAGPDAAATTVDSCSFDGHSALLVPQTLPGPVSVAAGVAVVGPGDHGGCVGGHADFLEEVIGAHTVGGSTCNQMFVVNG